MSDAHSHSGSAHGGGGPDNLHDMSLGKIVVVGVVSLVLFAAGILWAYQLMVGMEREVRASGAAHEPTEIRKQEIGIVDQVPFDIDRRLDIWKAEHAKRLSEYGWVDRAKGIARMPIDKAMQQVVAEPPDIPGEGVPPAARVPTVATLPSPSTGKRAAGKAGKAGEDGKP